MKFDWVSGVTTDTATALSYPNLLHILVVQKYYRIELRVLVHNMEGSATHEREEVTGNSAVEHDTFIW